MAEPSRSLRERVGALRNLRPFLSLVWHTAPGLTMANVGLRLIRALLPVATLYLGKLIIDEVIRLAGATRPTACAAWFHAGLLDRLLWLLGLELEQRSSQTCWAASSRWSMRCSRIASPTPSASA